MYEAQYFLMYIGFPSLELLDVVNFHIPLFRIASQ